VQRPLLLLLLLLLLELIDRINIDLHDVIILILQVQTSPLSLVTSRTVVTGLFRFSHSLRRSQQGSLAVHFVALTTWIDLLGLHIVRNKAITCEWYQILNLSYYRRLQQSNSFWYGKVSKKVYSAPKSQLGLRLICRTCLPILPSAVTVESVD